MLYFLNPTPQSPSCELLSLAVLRVEKFSLDLVLE